MFTAQPLLTSFSLDMTPQQERLILNFNQLVSQSCNSQGLTLQNEARSPTSNFTFQTAMCSYMMNASTLNIMIDQTEWMVIQADYNLATTTSNTYIHLAEGFVTDMDGRNNAETTLRVSTFVPNTNPPSLIGGIVEIQTRLIGLLFTEGINISTVDPRGVTVTFINNMTSLVQNYTLTDGIVVSGDTTNQVGILLSSSDFEVVRLATPDHTTFFLTIAANSFYDGSGMPNAYQANVMIFQFIIDNTPPNIDSFTLDLNSGSMSLFFSERIQNDSIDYSQIFLIGNGISSQDGYSLNGSLVISITAPSLTTEPIVSIQLPARVQSIIASDTTFCSSVQNCFLTWRNDSFRDLNGNLAIESSFPIPPINIILDMTSPTLSFFTMDLDNGILNLTFSEPINTIDAFLVSAVILTDGVSQQEDVSGTILEDFGGLNAAISILLSSRSLNIAKNLTMPRLAIQASATIDAAGNTLTPVSIMDSLQAFSIIPDQTSPVLLGFIPNDPSSRQIILTFDEFVNTASWNGNQLQITLQVSAGDITNTSFTRGMLTPTFSDRIMYTFDSTDEYIPPFSSQFMEGYYNGSIILRAGEGLLTDIAGNSLSSSGPFTYTTQPPDVTPPSLVSFNLDINMGLLQMTFNEPVNILSPINQILFIDNSSILHLTQVYTLIGNGTFSTGMGSLPMLSLILDTEDLNAIKVNQQLCSSSSNTFLIVSSGLAEDRSGNRIQENTIGIQVSNYIPDTEPPTISSSNLDLDIGELVIEFSEPILINMLDLSRIYLTGSSREQNGLNLSGSVIRNATNFDTSITFFFSVFSLNTIKISQSICTTRSNCFIYASANSYRDTSNNSVLQSTINARISTLIPDSTRPIILAYNLDLNTGVVTLSFDEPIDSITFNPTGLTFIATSSSLTYSLTDAFFYRTESLNTTVQVLLGPDSLNEVKLLNTQGASLAADSSTARDVAMPPNSLTSISPLNSLQFSMFVPDITPPELVSFRPGFPNETDITFLFSEFVNGSSLREDQITLRLSTRQGIFEYSTFNEGRVTSILISERITYTFSQSDFNETLRSQYSKAISNGSVSLLLGAGFIFDLNNNFLMPILTPVQFTTDNIRPTLLNFTLDLDMGLIDLSFSEAVNIFSVAGMARLQNAPESPTVSINIAQNGTIIPDSVASSAVVFRLSETDLNNIKTASNIGTSISNTYLALEESIARDLSGNLLSPGQRATQAFIVLLDTSRPLLNSFTFDIDQGIVTLRFSESVSTITLNHTRIYLTGMLQAQPTGYNLSGSSSQDPAFSQIISLFLPLNLLNMIKADPLVCSSRSNCLLFAADGAVTDVSGNFIIPSPSSITADMHIEDTVSPELNSFTLDLNSRMITLTFSEPILIQGFNPSEISASSVDSSIQLGDVSIISTESSNTIIRLLIGSDLLNQLKVLSSIGSITLSLSSNTAVDTSSLNIIPIPPSNSLVPSLFVPDTSPPTLLQFIPSSGVQLEFTLVFDEFVRPSSVTRNLLSFTLKNQNGQFNYTDLSSAAISPASSNSDHITLTFPSSDARFTDPSFRQSYMSSYNQGSICFNLVPAFVTDVNNNAYSGRLLIVYSNRTDTERPRLVSFTLNLNTSALNLTFSERVNVLTIAGNARIQDSASTPVIVYNLMQNGTVISSQGNVVTIMLGSSDLNNLISIPSLATSASNTYLLLLEPFAIDFSGNLLNDSQTAIRASQVTQVIIGTMILSFDLDLDSDIMTLQFDRPVNVSTFVSNRITLTNVSSTSIFGQTNVQLSNVEVLERPWSVVSMFRMVLSVNNSISIKGATLCYSRSNCFASFMSGLVSDTTGNSTSATTLQVNTLLLDVTPPRFVAFPDFDLNQGRFTLIFSEPVNGSSTDFTDVQFSDRVTNPTVSITLREGFTTRDHIVINFLLTNDDLNRIKLIEGLCTSRVNCWIILPSFFINDIGMNPFLHSNFQPDAQASFHQPLNFIPDTTLPMILEFNVDMNLGNMSILFSEAILERSFQPGSITLLNSPSGRVMFQLSSATNFTVSNTGDKIYIHFTKSDFDSIKSLNLYSSQMDSYLSLIANGLSDTSSNIVLDITPSDAIQVSRFTEDVTRPHMISFDLYNNDNGSLVVSFDEPVNIDTLMVTEVTLLSRPMNLTNVFQYTLTGGNIRYLRNDELSLLITMTSSDLRAVKIITELATGPENTYISVTNRTITDRNSNQVVAIPPSMPLQLNRNGFVSDLSRASIIGYTFNLSNAQISLTFSDVLDISSLDVSQLIIQNNQTFPSESYALRNSSTTSGDSDIFNITLGVQDMNTIQLNLNLATNITNTFISFRSSLIRDISGLEVIPVQSSSAIGPRLYFPDQVNPSLSSFSLDMNAGLVTLTFSEAVLVNSARPNTLTFQDSMVRRFGYTLTDGIQQFSGETALSIQIQLIYMDLNRIKSIQGVATALNDTFLQVVEDFIVDTNNNRIQPVTLQATSYTRDSISPMLLNFDLNLTGSGTLRLQFSEAISYTSTVENTIVLQNTPFSPSTTLMLTSGEIFSTLPILDTVDVTLSSTLFGTLLTDPSIGQSSDILFLSISVGGFRDFSNNDIVTIPSNQARRVRYICEFMLV